MYDVEVSDVVAQYGGCDLIRYMFYSKPGNRDMLILKSGIEDVYKHPYFVKVEEITEEQARAYDVKRGWLITFIFTYDIKETKMAEWISMGLDELRVKHELEVRKHSCLVFIEHYTKRE